MSKPIKFLKVPEVTTEQVLNHYSIPIEYTDKRGNFICYCAFHNDRGKPNFSISSFEGIYKCWSCGASGNLVTLIAHLEKVTNKEAYKILNNFETHTSHSNYLQPLLLNPLREKPISLWKLHHLTKVLYEILYFKSRPKWHTLFLGTTLYKELCEIKMEVEDSYEDILYRRKFVERAQLQLELALKALMYEELDNRYYKFLQLVSSSGSLERLLPVCLQIVEATLVYKQKGFSESVASYLYEEHPKFVLVKGSIMDRSRVHLLKKFRS